MTISSIEQRVYRILRMIPSGKVLTYGDVAKVAGNISPRLVGRILHRNPSAELNPCHRVVFADGKLAPAYAFGGENVQRSKLKKEGVVFQNEKVDLNKCRWRVEFV